MGPRDKARLFHDLYQLIRSGTPFPKAIEVLLRNSHLKGRSAFLSIQNSLTRGATIPEALSAESSLFGSLDCGVISASDRSGSLDKGFQHLAEYYEQQAKAISSVWNKIIYPAFLLHLGVLLLNLPDAVRDNDWSGYALKVFKAIGTFWGSIGAAILLLNILLDAASRSSSVDLAILRIPGIGKIRRSFMLSRFFRAYDMQLEAGANVVSSLEASAGASGSAAIQKHVRVITPAILDGEQVAPMLGKSSVFPPQVIQSLIVGEQTGHMDQELQRLAVEFQEAGLKRLDLVAEWLPRIIYLIICLFLASKILGIMTPYYKAIEDLSH